MTEDPGLRTAANPVIVQEDSHVATCLRHDPA